MAFMEHRRRLTAAALAAALLLGGLAAAPSAPAATPVPTEAQLAKLEAEVIAGEDLSALKRLQRAYGYYVSKGLWEDVADLFTDDGVGHYPDGTYVGKTSLRLMFLQNEGQGKLGLGEGRLKDHMILQPVVHLDTDGRTARGRWRLISMNGRLGGETNWQGGVYENVYVKEGGVWKISVLRFLPSFSGAYENGWSGQAPPAGTPFAVPPGKLTPLAHPHAPDRPIDGCRGYPAACSSEFHYANAGSAAFQVWHSDLLPAPPAAKVHGPARLANLATRTARLKDEQELENLLKIYAYYLDRGRWDQAGDLFAADGTLEIGQAGVYVGPARIKAYLGLDGPLGLREGQLNDRMMLQPIVMVAKDGLTARGYSREWSWLGETTTKTGSWEEGTYETVFAKQGGIWRIQSMHLYSNSAYDYDKGWGKDAKPARGPSATLPADRPPTVVYASYPKQIIAPFPFNNPVTGKAPRYPSGVVMGKLEAAPKLSEAQAQPATYEEVATAAERVKDRHAIENLQDAYGHYADKGHWVEMTRTLGKPMTIELALRGVYVGRESVANFLLNVFGRNPGPQPNSLGDHMSLQPVVNIAPDGKSATMRARAIQVLGAWGRSATWGGAIYDNAAVKEDGVWRMSKIHAYNTFTATYHEGWFRGQPRGLPGPSAQIPPDRPPSEPLKPLPTVYPIPFQYKNPVTGR